MSAPVRRGRRERADHRDDHRLLRRAARARADDFFIYPDYYLFHVGRSTRRPRPPRRVAAPQGGGGRDDPSGSSRRSTTAGSRACWSRTALPAEPALEPGGGGQRPAPRIATCLAYSAAGRVADADVRIASNPVTEGYVEAILEPRRAWPGCAPRAAATSAPTRSAPGRRGRPRGAPEAPARARAELVEDGVPVETYRRIDLDEALCLLGAQRRGVDPPPHDLIYQACPQAEEVRRWHR